MTPDRSFAPEVMGMNLVPYMRALQDKDGDLHRHLPAAGGASGTATGCKAIDRHRTTCGAAQERQVDQIVVNHGTQPLADLYFDLKPLSENLGAVDYDALIDGRPQTLNGGPRGFQPLPHRRCGGGAQHPCGDL